MIQASNLITKETPKRERSKSPASNRLLMRACNVSLTLFCLSGLFLGALLPDSPLCKAVAGREVILGNSLLGLIVERLQGSLSLPSASPLPVLLYELPLVLTVTIALSLLFTIFSMLFPRAAEKLAYWNGVAVCLGFGTAVVLCYAAGKTFRAAIAYDVLIPLAASALLLAVFDLIRKRNLGGFLLFLISLSALMTAFTPETPLRSEIHAAFLNPLPLENTICLFLFLGVSVCNAVAGVFRIHAKKAYLLDIVRFSLHCALVPAYFAMRCIADRSTAFLTALPILLTVTIALPVIGLALSVFLYSKDSSRRTARR